MRRISSERCCPSAVSPRRARAPQVCAFQITLVLFQQPARVCSRCIERVRGSHEPHVAGLARLRGLCVYGPPAVNSRIDESRLLTAPQSTSPLDCDLRRVAGPRMCMVPMDASLERAGAAIDRRTSLSTVPRAHTDSQQADELLPGHSCGTCARAFNSRFLTMWPAWQGLGTSLIGRASPRCGYH